MALSGGSTLVKIADRSSTKVGGYPADDASVQREIKCRQTIVWFDGRTTGSALIRTMRKLVTDVI